MSLIIWNIELHKTFYDFKVYFGRTGCSSTPWINFHESSCMFYLCVNRTHLQTPAFMNALRIIKKILRSQKHYNIWTLLSFNIWERRLWGRTPHPPLLSMNRPILKEWNSHQRNVGMQQRLQLIISHRSSLQYNAPLEVQQCSNLRAEENSIHAYSRHCTDTIHPSLSMLAVYVFNIFSSVLVLIFGRARICDCPTRNPTTLVCRCCCYFCCTLQHTLLHTPHTVNPARHREIRFSLPKRGIIFWAKQR